jgi:hypothetical protein
MGARFTPNVPQAQKSFLAHPMVLLGDVCHVKVRFDPFGDSVSLGTYWCTVYTECTTGMKIFLGTPDSTSW